MHSPSITHTNVINQDLCCENARGDLILFLCVFLSICLVLDVVLLLLFDPRITLFFCVISLLRPYAICVFCIFFFGFVFVFLNSWDEYGSSLLIHFSIYSLWCVSCFSILETFELVILPFEIREKERHDDDDDIWICNFRPGYNLTKIQKKKYFDGWAVISDVRACTLMLCLSFVFCTFP